MKQKLVFKIEAFIMSEISNKKRKFIRRNFKILSMEVLALQTGLKPHIIKSLIDECADELSDKKFSSTETLANEDNSQKRFFYRALRIAAIVIPLLVFLVYTPTLKNDFINQDDGTYVYGNKHIHSVNSQFLHWMVTTLQASNWHPLTWLSHAIDYFFWGLNPFGHHLTSIFLHSMNTLLVLLFITWLARRAYVDPTISPRSTMPLKPLPKSLAVGSITALLFGLHPIHVESVAWVAERKDLLCAFFFLFTLLSYLNFISPVAQRKQWQWFYACLLFFMLALMSKPMAVTLPAILLLLDVYPLKRIGFANDTKNLSVVLEKVPFFVLSILSSIITIIAQSSGGSVQSLENLSISTRTVNACNSLIFYLQKIFWPFDLIPFYPLPQHIYFFDPQSIICGMLVLLIIGGCIWMLKSGKYLFFSVWSYYMITLLPVLGIIQVGNQAAADRYTYLPSIGIFLLVGVGIVWAFQKGFLAKNKVMVGVVSLGIIGVLTFLGQLTIKQIKVWQNSEGLWTYVINAFPGKAPIAHNNLGLAYYSKGMLDKAIAEYEKALSINPKLALAHNNLGTAYASQKGMLDKAVAEYEKALIIDPKLAKAHYNLGLAYYYTKNYSLAKNHFDKAIEYGYDIDPKLLELTKSNQLIFPNSPLP